VPGGKAVSGCGGRRPARIALVPAASLVKVATAAAALEKGEISPDEEIAYRGGSTGSARGTSMRRAQRRAR
jgi:hypothetical protein